MKKKDFSLKDSIGYRNKYSTADALTDITERIRDACDKEYYAYTAFLYFRRAFNSVNHEILSHYGTRAQAVN